MCGLDYTEAKMKAVDFAAGFPGAACWHTNAKPPRKAR